jgi:hypothetical protein
LFVEAEALARQLGTSRSGLYAGTLRECLARHQPDAITTALDRVYSDEQATPDPIFAAAAAAKLAAPEW